MDSILHGIDEVACCIDDIIITSKTDQKRLEDLEEVLQCLLQHGVLVKGGKCKFLLSSVNFPGHRVDAGRIHITKDKKLAIINAPAPKNVQELCSF